MYTNRLLYEIQQLDPSGSVDPKQASVATTPHGGSMELKSFPQSSSLDHKQPCRILVTYVTNIDEMSL